MAKLATTAIRSTVPRIIKIGDTMIFPDKVAQLGGDWLEHKSVKAMLKSGALVLVDDAAETSKADPNQTPGTGRPPPPADQKGVYGAPHAGAGGEHGTSDEDGGSADSGRDTGIHRPRGRKPSRK